jgi:hypothetical protein
MNLVTKNYYSESFIQKYIIFKKEKREKRNDLIKKIEENKKIELEKIRNRTKHELERLEKEYAVFDQVGKSFSYVAVVVLVGFYFLISAGDSFKFFAFIRSGCVFELPKKRCKNKKQNNKKKMERNQVGLADKTRKTNSDKRNFIAKISIRNVKIENEKVERENHKRNERALNKSKQTSLFKHKNIRLAKNQPSKSQKDNSLKVINLK